MCSLRSPYLALDSRLGQTTAQWAVPLGLHSNHDSKQHR